jgi:hypothetical protein
MAQVVINPSGGGLPAIPPEQGVEPPLAGEQSVNSKYVAVAS